MANERVFVPSRNSRRAAAMLLAVMVMIGYLWLRHGTLSTVLRSLGFGAVPLHDFQGFFYPLGRALLSQPEPIDGFVYSAFAALFFAPIGALPYTAAAWLWGLLLICLTFVTALHSVRRTSFKAEFFFSLLVFGSMPLWHNLKFGQVSVLLVAALFGCLYFYERGRRVYAAGLLAFAISFKFYPVIFLSYFVFRRDARMLCQTLCIAFVLMLVLPSAVLGAQDCWSFYQQVNEQLDARFGATIADVNSQSLRSVSERLLSALHVDARCGSYVVGSVSVLIFAGFLRVTYDIAQSTKAEAPRWAFLWMFCATPFFVSTSWPHYFIYLPAVCIAVFSWALEQPASHRLRGAAIGCVAIAAALSHLFVFDAWGSRRAYSAWGTLFLANLFATLGVALAWSVQRKAQQVAPSTSSS